MLSSEELKTLARLIAQELTSISSQTVSLNKETALTIEQRKQLSKERLKAARRTL